MFRFSHFTLITIYKPFSVQLSEITEPKHRSLIKMLRKFQTALRGFASELFKIQT